MTPPSSQPHDPRHVHLGCFMVPDHPLAGQRVCFVTLAYQLSWLVLRSPQIASLVALGSAAADWKFLWSPVVDITLTQETLVNPRGHSFAPSAPVQRFFPATKGRNSWPVHVGFSHAALPPPCSPCRSRACWPTSTPEELKGHVAAGIRPVNLGGVYRGGLGVILVGHLPAP